MIVSPHIIDDSLLVRSFFLVQLFLQLSILSIISTVLVLFYTMSGFGLGKPNYYPATSDQEGIEPSTPWVAAADGNLALLKLALETLNLPPSAADENGYTLLQAAASYSHLPVIEWLLDQRDQNGTILVSPNQPDGEGDTSLHYASSVQAAKILVEKGQADAKIENNDGKTPLQVKQEELDELMEDEEEDSQDAEDLRELIAYLSSLHQ